MRPFCLAFVLAAAIAMLPSVGSTQQSASDGPYKILKKVKVGGDGGFDYIFADSAGRRLYTPRNGAMGHLDVFNLDTLEKVGQIDVKSGGAAVDPKSHHGFSTTKPITMWDSSTLKIIKTIDVDGRPDGIMFDPYNARIWVLSHMAPYATVIDAREGTVVGTIDTGGEPEQAASDGKGTVYVNIQDKSNIAVINAKTLAVTAHYDYSSKGTAANGLSLDAKNHILFVYPRQPSPMAIMLSAKDGKIITTLPTGDGVDTVAFNENTMEAISTDGASGTITIIKESSPTSFAVEQTLPSMAAARTMALDTKTGHVLTQSAEYEPPPANATTRAPGRPARGPMIPGSYTILMAGK